jgi:assimilatory nitrate reductase electron transfer subunit
VVRLKAYGLDVVAMGRCGSRRTPGGRTVRLSDPETGRYVEVVVEGGVVVGATCVGGGAVAADLVTAYTRRTPAPADPAQLLLRPVRGAAAGGGAEASPTLMPDRATVCRCNGVTKGDLVAAWRSGATSTEEIATATRATTGCGGCTEAVCGLVDWLRKSDPPAASLTTATPAKPSPTPASEEPAAVRATRARGSFVP